MLLLPQLATGTGLLVASAIKAPIAPWISRKIVHIGVGTLLLNADVSDPEVVTGIYAASTAVAGYTTFKGFEQLSAGRETEGVVKDMGIFSYAIACCSCLALSIPYQAMAPLFYADPAGAIVGRLSQNTTIPLYQDKSVQGTVAVFTAAALSTDQELPEKLLVGILVATIELFGGKIDNSLIALFLMIRYLIQIKI